MFSPENYEFASQQRPTSSYFIYNDNKNLFTSFPTGAMGGIRVLAINQNIYGNKVLPNHFILSSSNYYVKDDGYGNLYDGSTHIGNIFYAHGLGIITNQDYQLMFPLTPIARNNTGSFLTSDVPKVISASLNDYARSGTLNTSSLALSGSTSGTGYSWATSSNGTVILTTATPGTYTVYYTIGANIAGSCATQLRSNKAKITAVITAPPSCDLVGIIALVPTTTSTTTTTTTAAPTTTSTTTSTTTAAPTTSTTTTTTTAPTTTSTTTTTTTAPTTTSTTTTTTTAPTTTSTTTTTTTAAPLYRYSTASETDACSTGLVMTNTVLIGGTFCDATAIQCDEFASEIAGISLYVRSGNSYRTATINDPNTSGIATFTAGCVLCPAPTTTTTSTTTTTTTSAPVTRNVNGVGGSASDILGEIYINASVSLDGNVSVDTVFDVNVTTVPYGTISVSVTIFNGNSTGSGSTSVGMGSLPSSISGECITACDNVNVVITDFTC
jgi:hypothetical protein